MKFTDDQRAEILRTAMITAGPGASATRIGEEVERVAYLMSDASLVSAGIDNVERKFEKVQEWKRFTGTILYVDKEISSNRAVIILLTQPSQHSPSGQEIIRTGITTYDPIARDLANNVAQNGIGQRALVNVAIEKMDNGNKVRVVHDVQLRGADQQFNPATQVDWASLKLDPAKLVGASQMFAQPVG